MLYNPTIVNIYTYYHKLVYKIIVNRGGYKITYFVVCVYIYIYYSVVSYKITYFVATLSYDNY